jgi:hypothetical protein
VRLAPPFSARRASGSVGPLTTPPFLAVRDDVAAQAPVGLFAATVLVWALLMRDSVEGTLEDWVQGRRG